MTKTVLALALAVSSLSFVTPASAQDCKGAYKSVRVDCSEKSGEEKGGKVSQTGGRTKNSSKY